MGYQDEDQFKWKQNTKVDKNTDDLIEEYANKFTNGNISAMLRQMIFDWIETTQQNEKDQKLPEKLQYLLRKREYRARVSITEDLQRTALDLARMPDIEMEQAAANLAYKYNLPWPITNIKPRDVDPDLSKIIKRIENTWWDGQHNGRMTLRELQRHLSGYNAEELKFHLDRLVASGDIEITGGTSEHTTLEIIVPVEKIDV
jgi:hypothetical protein